MSYPGQHPHTDTGEAEKFSLDATEFSLENTPPLPEWYGDDRLVAMVRDPKCIFLYWEWTPGNAERVRREGGSNIWEISRLILRVYELPTLGGNGLENAPSFDIDMQGNPRQWYILLPKSGGVYVVEVGLRRPDGRFFALLRSNRVQLPTGSVSDQMDSDFASVRVTPVDGEDPMAFLMRDLDKIGKGSAEFSKTMAQRWEFLRSVFSGVHVPAPSSWSLPSSHTLPSSGSTPSGRKP